MNSIVGDRYIAELVQIFELQGSALYSGQHSLCLTAPCLHYIQRKLAASHEATGSPQFAHLQQLQESFSRIMVLKLITDKHYQLLPTTTLTLEPFKAVHSLIIKKIPLNLVTGLSRLRPQIRLLVIQRSGLQSVEEVLDKCGGDNSAPFSWASLKEMDLSHNTVSQLGPSLQFLTAIEKMDLSNNAITDTSTGIEFIDSVSHLHLGFNQLTVVPRLGPRAKFNLTGLNLRNNRLSTIEGLQELDSLTDLDLTDNLLTRHSDLKPLQNLHNLSLLSVIGNPLSFHSKHRLKTVEALSDLINPSSFRLDNKRLTSNEKKAIPRSPTHYPHSSPSISSLTPSVSPLHTHHTLTPPPSSHLVKGSSPSRHSDTVIISKRRRKKPPATRVVALDDSDEDSLNDTGGSAATDMPSSSSVPLKYERRLQRMKDLAKQMPDKWLLSNASLDTTSSESNQMARGASQPLASVGHHPASMLIAVKATGDSILQSKVRNGDSRGAADVKPRTSTPIPMPENDEVSGECFLVERYESDVEEGGEEGEHILLTLSDRFLEEKDANGETLDRMDLGCLMSAEVHKKVWKSTQESEVVVLQFRHERRDRRKREYVMIEQNHDSIIEILAPISKDNQEAFSLASKVECFTCQRVFESKLLSDSNQHSPPTSPAQPHSFAGHQRISLANCFCPFCKSQRLQYTSQAFKPATLSTSASPRVPVHSEHSTVDGTTTADQAVIGNVESGFVVSETSKHIQCVPNSKSVHQIPNGKGCSASRPVSTRDWDSLENAQSYNQDNITNSDSRGDMQIHCKSSEYLVPEKRQTFSTSSWSFGELSSNQTSQNMRSSRNVLYHSDTCNMENADRSNSRHDTEGMDDARCDTRDTDNLRHDMDSSRHSARDMDDSRHDTGYAEDLKNGSTLRCDTDDTGNDTRNIFTADSIQDTSNSRYDKWNKTGHKHSTIYGEVNDLSRNGSRSTRLTNSEPIPTLHSYTEATWEQEEGRHRGREIRHYSSPEQPISKLRNQFDEESTFRHRSSADSFSCMNIHRGGLDSVQEQPISNSLNPFDNESCSTNPFDEEESSNPFCVKDGEHRSGVRGERGGEWNGVPQKGRGQSFSQNEERYFTDFKSHHLMTGEKQHENQIDFDIPRHLHHVPTSSSVPATSYMTSFAGHMTFGNMSRESYPLPKKSSTLPCGRSPISTQESPELSKRSSTLPQGKPPIHGRLVRGKSMESLDRSSPRNEQHPHKSNRISPSLQKREEDPLFGSRTSKSSMGGPRVNGDSRTPQRNNSTPPCLNPAGKSGDGNTTPEAKRGHSSSDTQAAGRGSRKKLNRMTSAGDVWCGGYSSGERGRGSGSGERDRSRSSGERGRGRSSTDGSRTSSRSSRRESRGGSSGGGGGRGMSGGSSGGGDSHRKVRKLSSSESSGRPLSSSVLIKDEDPSYIHNSLNLHLDMEVFSTEHGEHFKMIFRAPMVRYMSTKEVPALVIFSNINTFIYRITAPQSSQPDKWLSLQQTLPLSKLVYLDVGPFHQFLRLEYSIPGACLTFLLRDKDKCRECLTRLSMIVSDCPRSTFKSVGIHPFHLKTITHPDRALRGAIMAHYDYIKAGSHKSRGGGVTDENEGVKLYMLAHRHFHTPGKKYNTVPVTVVVANDVIYMGRENFHQWPLPRLQELPPKESLEAPFSSVERKDITDIEQITMDPDQTCQVVLRFFKETVGEGDSKYWSLTTELGVHVQQLIRAIQAPWENMFETTLPVKYK